MSRTGRTTVAFITSLPLFVLMVYTGLIAGLTIVQQVVSGFIDLGQASWTSFLNPAYLLGIQSLGGTGNIFDSLVGGPGAPGGTVSRYVIFMLTGLLAAGAFMGMKGLWSWVSNSQETR